MYKQALANMWNKAFKYNKANILSLFEHAPSSKLIDLGCDDGKWSKKIGDTIGTNEVFGVEILEDRISMARELGIKVVAGNLNDRIPFDDNFFDVVNSTMVIEHLSSIDNFVSEIYRVLKPGGYAVISTENASSWCNIFAAIMGWQIFSLTNVSIKQSGIGNPFALYKGIVNDSDLVSWTHKTILNYQGLIDLFKVYNFNITDIRGAGYFPLPNFLARIDKRHSHFLTIRAVSNK